MRYALIVVLLLSLVGVVTRVYLLWLFNLGRVIISIPEHSSRV